MTELARHAADRESGPTHFRAVDLQVDGRSVRIQRLDARAAVDAARLRSLGARRALVTASATLTGDTASARVAADEATEVLRTALRILTELGAVPGVSGSPKLDVDIEIHPDAVTTVVRPHGDLDLQTSPRLEEICIEQLDGGAPLRGLQVDLSAVSFLDSSGLAVLVEVQRDCAERDTVFTLAGPTEKCRRLLEITHLDSVFTIV